MSPVNDSANRTPDWLMFTCARPQFTLPGSDSDGTTRLCPHVRRHDQRHQIAPHPARRCTCGCAHAGRPRSSRNSARQPPLRVVLADASTATAQCRGARSRRRRIGDRGALVEAVHCQSGPSRCASAPRRTCSWRPAIVEPMRPTRHTALRHFHDVVLREYPPFVDRDRVELLVMRAGAGRDAAACCACRSCSTVGFHSLAACSSVARVIARNWPMPSRLLSRDGCPIGTAAGPRGPRPCASRSYRRCRRCARARPLR